jgi:4'-phosphopantetheinyl transferase
VVSFPGLDEVHVWRINLSQEKEQFWCGILTNEEQERVNRYHFAADRRRITVTRALLRTLLGRYLDAAPKSLDFEYNKFGKPALAGSQNPRGLHFNVAHSGNWSLLAFGLAAHLGVDVEHLHVDRNVEYLAKAVLSPSQYASSLALPDAERKRAFLEAWTRKEAIVKALGGGLSIPLDSFEVEDAYASEWFVRNIQVDGDYAAAIAVSARNIDVRLWNWTVAGGTA